MVWHSMAMMLACLDVPESCLVQNIVQASEQVLIVDPGSGLKR